MFTFNSCALFEDFGEVERRQIPPGNNYDDGNDDGNGGSSCKDFPDEGFDNQVASLGVDNMEGGIIVFTGANFTSASYAEQVLSIEIFESIGADLNPGMVNLGGANANYATCSVCVMLHEGVSIGDGQIQAIKRKYMAVNGVLNITSLEPTIGGSFSGVLSADFVEVTIDTNYQSRIVEDGCETDTDAFAFSVALTESTLYD